MKRLTLIVVCALLVPAVAGAGLVIKEKTSSSGHMGMWSSEGTEVTYLKGDKMRTESLMKTKGIMPGMEHEKAAPMITIIRLDKGVMWQLDDDESTYTEVALGSQMQGASGQDFVFKLKDVKVSKTGKKRKIAGYECEGVAAEMVFETSAGDETITQTVENLFWIASKAKGLGEMRSFWEQMVEVTQGMQQGYPMGDAMKQLWEKMEDIKGVPLGMEMTMARPTGGTAEDDDEIKEAMKVMREFMKGQGASEEESPEEAGESEAYEMKMTREVISISQEKIDDSLFEIPQGYTKSKQTHPMMYQKPTH